MAPPDHETPHGDRALTLPEVMALLAISRHTVERLVRSHGLPPPRCIGTRTKRWLHSEVVAWLARQPAAYGIVADAPDNR